MSERVDQETPLSDELLMAAVDAEPYVAQLLEAASVRIQYLEEYSYLLARGLSDYEARGTVWPEEDKTDE